MSADLKLSKLMIGLGFGTLFATFLVCFRHFADPKFEYCNPNLQIFANAKFENSVINKGAELPVITYPFGTEKRVWGFRILMKVKGGKCNAFCPRLPQ